ncbi:hypothetical protein V5O48_010275 [Marasmius crinis-equi]|uniref:Nucleolar complex-associated protein 3 n=1 Tax=Marasmius crinis-equi TaxID=585013 RepID=A0ABR3F902_9AGAR
MAKRPAAAASSQWVKGSRKKPKLGQKANSTQKPAVKPKGKGKGKERAADRDIIPIPNAEDEDQDEANLSEEDLELLKEYGSAAKFLGSLDRKGISRSKKETARLHGLNKPVRKTAVDDDLPSVDSHDEDDAEWSSGMASDDEEKENDFNGGSWSSAECEDSAVDSDSDVEMPYEKAPRIIRDESKTKNSGVQRLPIKLADGTVKGTGRREGGDVSEQEGDEEEEEMDAESIPPPPRDDVATGARFGRAAVIDVVSTKSKKARIQAAKDQIASICQDIVAEPENSLGLLKRLHTFSLSSISTPTHPDPVSNDPLIRKLSILSQLAVFRDIVPGYRIRALTDKEKAEKVSQVVARTRDWEQGLVVAYQTYLRLLETELKARSELAETCLRCICTLLTELTHFNFRVNLMSCVVAQLSKKTRNESFDLCLETLITVFRNDSTGAPSLEIVRLLNRMIKEKRYNVHPASISSLLYLRLKTELGGVRSSDTKAGKEKEDNVNQKSKGKKKRGKGEEVHLSKKAVKALKERKEIEKEFREAEAEVDKEERAVTHTETLKLVFVLYFSILKNNGSKRLLPAALEGIAKFAHLVNIDFFKDLMKVLKELIAKDEAAAGGGEGIPEGVTEQNAERAKHKLLCVVTAFELLTGQGEALAVDLDDFITHLYAIIPSLSMMFDIDSPTSSSTTPNAIPQAQKLNKSSSSTLADTLLRALNLIFLPRGAHAKAHPTYRSAAFSKRLLTACLHFPSAVIPKILEFIENLVGRDSKLLSLLGDDEDGGDAQGVYNPTIDDPQLANALGGKGGRWFELYVLREQYWDKQVREAAERIIEMGVGRR